MHCDETPDLLGPYLEERLDDARRREMREHLQGCVRCREHAVERDPTLLFALARPATVDPARSKEMAAAVLAQIHGRRLERRLARRRHPWLAAAAAVMVVVGAGTVWRMTADAPEQPVAAGPAAVGAGLETEPPRAEVDMEGAGVRVYQFADQSGERDRAVYYVVNPALES